MHARFRNLGIALRAMATTDSPNLRAPLRLVDAEAPNPVEALSDSSTPEKKTREQTDTREIDESQKAVTERIRDQYWSW